MGEILQNFQDMLNEIEVTKSLLENKKKDFEIRKEAAKVHAISMTKKLELTFDEILDFVQDQKMKSMKQLENKNKVFLKDLEGKEQSIDDRIASKRGKEAADVHIYSGWSMFNCQSAHAFTRSGVCRRGRHSSASLCTQG